MRCLDKQGKIAWKASPRFIYAEPGANSLTVDREVVSAMQESRDSSGE
jgi:hypothetical protein